MNDNGQTPDHGSRQSSERAGYERLRSHGIGHSDATRIAREASESVHKNQDRIHSDRGRR